MWITIPLIIKRNHICEKTANYILRFCETENVQKHPRNAAEFDN